MKILINGSKDFDDYNTFLRAMGVMISDLKDKELILMLTGNYKTNDLARVFVNLSEKSFKSRGKLLNYVHVSGKEVDWDSVDAVVILVKPPQKNTPLGYEAERQDKDVHVFRY